MVARNKLFDSPPYPVESTVARIGKNLRLARRRRNMTIADVAQRIGTGPRAVRDAERGNLATGVAVYAALLWLYDQLQQLDAIADPANDTDAMALEISNVRTRARRAKGLDNDF